MNQQNGADPKAQLEELLTVLEGRSE